MKETVINKQGERDKQEELKLLKEVQARENREEMREQSDKMKQRREQEQLRVFLANQVKEKEQVKALEREK